MQKVLGCFQERLAYSEKPMEDIAGEREIMAWKKNAEGKNQYSYKFKKTKTKIIQKDWFKEHGYKRDKFSPQFFENVEKKLTPARRGYWAYAIDGDGSIGKNGKNSKGIMVVMPLKDREPVQQLADIYRTSISFIEYPEESWEPTYVTRLTGKRAYHFLCLICPYMTEKRKKATQLINIFDPNYHPLKISMNFRQNPDLLYPHMGMIGGFFDTEGSVGIRPREHIRQTKKFGERIYTGLNPWVDFSSTDTRPLRKIKKILETWPFNFTTTIRVKRKGLFRKNGEECNACYALVISKYHHLLFMKMFSPWILITRKREYAEKFERKEQIYEMCKNEIK